MHRKPRLLATSLPVSVPSLNTACDSVHRSRLVRLLTIKTACEKIALAMREKSALAVHRGWLDSRHSADVLLSFAVMQGRESYGQASDLIR